jgi:hypothetical protein
MRSKEGLQKKGLFHFKGCLIYIDLDIGYGQYLLLEE